MNKCFAESENGDCKILDDKSGTLKCENYTQCNFYKTKEACKESRRNANKRLRSLPISKQRKIADKYYKGSKEW